MVFSSERYEAVASTVVLCTHCGPVKLDSFLFTFIAAKDEGAWGDQAKAAFLNAEGKGARSD